MVILFIVFFIAVAVISCGGKMPVPETGPITSMTITSDDGSVGILVDEKEYTYIDRRNGFQVSAPIGTWDIFSKPIFEKPLPSGRRSNRVHETSRYWRKILDMSGVAVVMGGPFEFDTPSRGRYKGVAVIQVFDGTLAPERRHVAAYEFLRWWGTGTESSNESQTQVDGYPATRWDYAGDDRGQKGQLQRVVLVFVQGAGKALGIHGGVFQESSYAEFSKDFEFILSSVKFLPRE